MLQDVSVLNKYSGKMGFGMNSVIFGEMIPVGETLNAPNLLL